MNEPSAATPKARRPIGARGPTRWSPLWMAVFLVAVTSLLLDPHAADIFGAEQALLSEQRWREHAYGVSLRSPAGAKLFEHVVDDAVPWTLGSHDGPNKVVFQDLQNRFQLSRIRAQMRHTILDHPVDPEADRQLLEALGQHSIGPKDKAHLLAHGTDDALLLIEDDIGYTIRVYMRKSTHGLHINEIAAMALGRVGADSPSAIIEAEQQIEVAGRPGALLYYRIPDTHEPDHVLGQVFIQTNQDTYTMLRLDCPYVLFNDVRTIFEAVIDSVEIESPAVLDEKRREALERGRMWRSDLGALDAQRRRAVIQPIKLLRIVQGQLDIGYMNIETREANELQMPGLAVVVRARVIQGSHAQDTESRFFLSDDDSHEMWSITTTARLRQSRNRTSPLASEITWVESGLRSDRTITVTRQELSRQHESRWEIPEGYVSQVELHLMDLLLPHSTTWEMGFYAYLTSANKIAYRTVRIEPLDDSGYRVITRPSPERGATMAVYDKDGRFQGRLLSGGRALIPTTIEQFEKIWKIKK